MSQVSNARGIRALFACILVSGFVVLSACSSGNRNRGVNATVGTNTGTSTAGVTVSLTSSTGVVTLNAGESLTLTATVDNDTNNAGVTWKLSGDGALSDVTSTTATYTAPSSLKGTSTPVISATASADTTQVATVTLLVSGYPVIYQTPLFPANVSVAYTGSVAAHGGTAPYTWSVSSGTLPDGLSLSGSTTSTETISGTPTTTGNASFTLKVTDTNSNSATIDMTLAINPALSCLLNGRYAFFSTGVSNGQIGVRAASINVDNTGAITGLVDRKDSTLTTSGESWSGSCTNRAGNSGQLALTGATDSPTFNFSATGSLQMARLQLISGSDFASAAGQLYQQTPSDFNLTKLAGNYAFGLLGAEANGLHAGYVGQLVVAANGTVTAGRIDSNTGSALNGATLTGALGIPDANGRGTLLLAGGSQTLKLAYYIVNASRLLVVSSDSSASAPILAGFMTRRDATFNASSLAGSSLLTLWGTSGTIQPAAVLSAGLLSGANASAGTLNMVLDNANRSTSEAGVVPTATHYGIETDGRVTLNFTTGTTARQLVGYLDKTSNGYFIEKGSSAGSAGLLEAQAPGPFSNSVPGLFVAGTQFPQTSAPVALMPITYLDAGTISSSSASGYVGIDASTGRGIGSLSISNLGGVASAVYILNPNKIVLLRFGAPSQNGAIEWLIQ